MESIGILSGASDRDIGLEQLYLGEYRAMLRLAYLLLRSHEAAEETVHDAFAEVYERWFRIREPGAYLRRAVVNRCRSRLRRRLVERKHLAALVDRRAAEGPDAPLLDALAKLPTRQRTAIVLRFYLDLPDSDIADAIGVRKGTVKSLVHRGITTLRQEIER